MHKNIVNFQFDSPNSPNPHLRHNWKTTYSTFQSIFAIESKKNK